MKVMMNDVPPSGAAATSVMISSLFVKFAVNFSDIYQRIVDDAVRAYELGPRFSESLERRLLEAPAIACSSAIGRWLKCRLRDAHWSQEELARRIGVDRSAVTR